MLTIKNFQSSIHSFPGLAVTVTTEWMDGINLNKSSYVYSNTIVLITTAFDVFSCDIRTNFGNGAICQKWRPVWSMAARGSDDAVLFIYFIKAGLLTFLWEYSFLSYNFFTIRHILMLNIFNGTIVWIAR